MRTEQRIPALFHIGFARKGCDSVTDHPQQSRFVKVFRVPPVAAAVPVHAFRVISPDYPSWFCTDAFSVRLMHREYRILRDGFGCVNPPHRKQDERRQSGKKDREQSFHTDLLFMAQAFCPIS